MISVIVPVYNAEKTIDRCLSSICNQTYRNIEIICINDGSTDNTEAFLFKIAQNDSRIKIINTTNAGVSKARNLGLNHAQGKAVLFVDSDDDLYSKHSLELLVAHLTDDVDGVISSAKVIHEYNYTNKSLETDQKYFSVLEDGKRHMNAQILTSTSVTTWAKLYRKSTIDSLQLRFPENLRFEDEFWFRAFFANRTAAFIQEPTYNYHRRAGSIMDQVANKIGTNGTELLRILEELIIFYKDKNLAKQMNDVILILAQRYFHTSQRYSNNWDYPNCLAILTNILRKYNIDCGNNDFLNKIKNGSYLASLYQQEETLKKLKKEIQQTQQLIKIYEKTVLDQCPELKDNGGVNLKQLALVLKRYRRLLQPIYSLLSKTFR